MSPSRPGAARRWWDDLWLRPAAPTGLVAIRTVLGAQALWIVLSRPDLPELAAWPAEFWRFTDPLLPLRFGIAGLPASAEWALFLLLHGSLVAALVGIVPRLACFLSALLLYHFAPFEEVIFGMPHTSFGGLTLPVLGLFIVAFAARPRLRAAPSPEFRWPVVLVRLLLAFHYLFPGLLKLRHSGLGWFTAENIQGWLTVGYAVNEPGWALWVAASPLACWLIAVGTLVIECGFPLAAVSRTAARILVPLAALFHVGIVLTLGYAFLSFPSLLVYLDWDRLHVRWASRGGASDVRDGARPGAPRPPRVPAVSPPASGGAR